MIEPAGSRRPRSVPPSGDPRRVVVTGLGPITSAGIGVEDFWEGLRRQESPVGPVTRFDASSFRSRVAAEVNDFDPLDFMDGGRARKLDRFGHFSLAAARLALEDAGLDPHDTDRNRVAVQMGSALGGIAHAEAQAAAFHSKGLRRVDPRLALRVFAGAASCNVAIDFGFRGPNNTNAMSCASGTIAVGEAWRLIREGAADAAVCGGIEAPLSPLSYGAFSIIRAMSTRNEEPAAACRPFDRGRDGFVMGEGAAALILEEERAARARGARIYAEVRGYAVNNDAHHMTSPRPDGSQAARCMADALSVGGVEAERVDWVSAHASSTPLNDSTESLALRLLLGDRAHRVPVSGTKPYYGHALGASGAIEAAVVCLGLERGWIPPTLNLEEAGEGCDLDYVPLTGRDLRPTTVLSNSFGFGGINASLVLSTYDPEGPDLP